MNNLYVKKRKVNDYEINMSLYDIANELLKVNPSCVFAISKTFKMKGKDRLGEEIIKTPCIASSVPLKYLIIPSCFKLMGDDYLSLWSNDTPIVQVIHKKFVFKDGNIDDKPVKDLFLKIK